jgi:hypothetical protein
MNAKKARAEEDEKAHQEFFKDYNPLDTAFAGVIVFKEKQKVQENADKHWGPGRFGKNPIHHRKWHEIMSASLTEEEEEYIRRQEREDEMESDDDNFNLKDNVDLAFEESGEEEEERGSSNEKDGV